MMSRNFNYFSTKLLPWQPPVESVRQDAYARSRRANGHRPQNRVFFELTLSPNVHNIASWSH